MTFTNTKSAGNKWDRYKVISQVDDQVSFQLNFQVNFQVNLQVNLQVNDQMDGQVFYQINPIKTKIKEDLIKFHKTIV